MVLKAMKNSLKKNCQEKHFCQKKIFGKSFLKFGNIPKFQSSCENSFTF